MKKAKKRKPAAKKAAKPAKRKRSAASTAKAGSKRAPVNKQPQNKQQAASAHGMFLYADDSWSLQYFDQNDLHSKEREVFG